MRHPSVWRRLSAVADFNQVPEPSLGRRALNDGVVAVRQFVADHGSLPFWSSAIDISISLCHPLHALTSNLNLQTSHSTTVVHATNHCRSSRGQIPSPLGSLNSSMSPPKTDASLTHSHIFITPPTYEYLALRMPPYDALDLRLQDCHV